MYMDKSRVKHQIATGHAHVLTSRECLQINVERKGREEEASSYS